MCVTCGCDGKDSHVEEADKARKEEGCCCGGHKHEHKHEGECCGGHKHEHKEGCCSGKGEESHKGCGCHHHH